MKDTAGKCEIEISAELQGKWQNIVDIMAELIGIPAALIMRLIDKDIEVFVSSQSEGNPYSPGDHEHFLGSGLYCETVINTNNKLLIPNALDNEAWKNNPDVKLNMISYLGFPILYPDGTPFGTICVLDDKTNSYSPVIEDLIRNFREVVQSELELVYMNIILGDENKKLSDYVQEIKTLRGIIPICTHCKKIKNDQGFWTKVEKYVEERTDARFSHGLCRECAQELYKNEPWFKELEIEE